MVARLTNLARRSRSACVTDPSIVIAARLAGGDIERRLLAPVLTTRDGACPSALLTPSSRDARSSSKCDETVLPSMSAISCRNKSRFGCRSRDRFEPVARLEGNPNAGSNADDFRMQRRHNLCIPSNLGHRSCLLMHHSDERRGSLNAVAARKHSAFGLSELSRASIGADDLTGLIVRLCRS